MITMSLYNAAMHPLNTRGYLLLLHSTCKYVVVLTAEFRNFYFILLKKMFYLFENTKWYNNRVDNATIHMEIELTLLS